MPGKAAKVVITERQQDVLQVMSRSLGVKNSADIESPRMFAHQ